jgi:hypothetical protein
LPSGSGAARGQIASVRCTDVLESSWGILLVVAQQDDRPDAVGGAVATSGVVGRRWDSLERLVRLLSATIIIGAIGGAVIGGLGGRLAMRILLLTSDESVKGLTSDDGFEIGRFSLSDTLGLVIVTALIGVIAALLYLVARPFVVRLGRAAVPAMALFYGVIGGALMVHRDGIDFHVLEPAVLAIVLFVSICAGFGATVAYMVDASAADEAWPQKSPRWLLAPPLLLLLFPPFLVVATAAVAVNWAGLAADPDDRAWQVVQVGAYAVMSGALILGAVDLARDTAGLT